MGDTYRPSHVPIARGDKCMAKKTTITLISIIVCSVILFATVGHLANQHTNIGFFIWMEGYIAAPVGSSTDIAFTYYYKENEPHLPLDKLASLATPDTDKIEIHLLSLSPMSVPFDGYSAYSCLLKFTFNESGSFAINTLDFKASDGSEYSMPIGDFIFEVDKTYPPLFLKSNTIYNSFAATSSPDEYPYDFDLPLENMSIAEIRYGLEEICSSATSLPTTARLELNTRAPIKVIAPKIKVVYEGETAIAYGSLCYCGAFGFSQEGLDASIEYIESRTGTGT